MATFTDAILGLGARLYDSPDGTTWTEVVSLMELGAPSDPEVEQIEISPVNPNNSNSVEYLNGMVKNGEFEFQQFYNSTRYVHHQSLRGTRYYYKVQLPDLATHSYAVIVGNVKKVKLTKIENKTPIGIEVKVQVCAVEVFTAGS